MENQIVLSMGSVLSIIAGFVMVFGWFYKLICKKIEAMDSKFEKKFDKVDTEIKDLRDTVTAFERNTEHRFGKMEVRMSVFENEMKNTNQRLSSIASHLTPNKVFSFKQSHQENEKEPKEN